MKRSFAYPVFVDYGIGIDNTVRLGRYGWVSPNITSANFQASQKGTAVVVVRLEHFDRFISSKEILRSFKKRGLRPAELHELLAFDRKYSHDQRKFPVVALGSVWRHPIGSDQVACIVWGDQWGKALSLAWFAGDWKEVCRFAAVRK